MGKADEDRKARLAQSLRDNLRRRKGQARESHAAAAETVTTDKSGDGHSSSE
jgi:hypothetical protein